MEGRDGERGRGGEGERGKGGEGEGEAIIVDDLCIIKVLVKTLQNSVPCNNF